jgi:hypothetical protein
MVTAKRLRYWTFEILDVVTLHQRHRVERAMRKAVLTQDVVGLGVHTTGSPLYEASDKAEDLRVAGARSDVSLCCRPFRGVCSPNRALRSAPRCATNFMVVLFSGMPVLSGTIFFREDLASTSTTASRIRTLHLALKSSRCPMTV